VTAVWFRFRVELRARWPAWLALAVLIGLVGGAVLALAAGARRTDSAYDRFVRAHDAYDVLVINNAGSFFSEGGTAIVDLDELAELPEVAVSARVGTFFVTIGAGVGVVVPADDRVGTEINRFRLLEGRRPDPQEPDEAVVSFTLAEQYDIGVGDEITLVDPGYAEIPARDVPPGFHAAVGRVLDVLDDGAVTVVGVEASPGEFPPQIEGSGRYLVHTSPALYRLRSDLAKLSEGGDSLLVRLERGARDTDAFLAEVERRARGFPPDLVVQEDFTGTVNRSFRTQAVALWLLASLTAVASALVVGQLLARFTLLESTDNVVLAALGASPTQRVLIGLARAGAIGLGASVVAVALALALSPAFPTGLARTAEPEPGWRVDAVVLIVGALVLVVLVVALSAWPAWRAAGARSALGASEPWATRPSLAGRLLSGRRIPVSMAAGVRMALEPGRGRTAVPVRTSLAGVTLGVATLVAALTFGASLAHLLGTPRLYGQTWNVELTTYDGRLFTEALPVLEADDRVQGLARGDFRTPFSIDGHAVDGFSLDTIQGELSPAILEGRAPDSPDEIALGTRTLRSLGLEVGDRVDVRIRATETDPVSMQVVGRAVFPVFAEAGRLGDGAFVRMAGTERILGSSLPNDEQGLLVRVTQADDVDAIVEELNERLSSSTELFVIRQGKPTDIVNFGRVEATPYLLGAILAALSAATLAYLLVSAVRRRRRDLAILKTLGLVRGQVRATVAWQATALTVVALLIGVPIGLAVGRWTWTLFADDLGVVSEPQLPWIATLVLVPVAVLVANLVAAPPARTAARTKPALVLRSE
jgi:ABC-type lipoprotein release transport system permease subunit